MDSSKIQQKSIHKKRVKRDEASGNIGENMNSEFHQEKVIKEMEFNDEISTMVVDGKEDELAIVKLVTLAFIDDDNVDVNWPACCPPHDPRDQPVDATSTAGPTG